MYIYITAIGARSKDYVVCISHIALRSIITRSSRKKERTKERTKERGREGAKGARIERRGMKAKDSPRVRRDDSVLGRVGSG